jgi:hypothetical protein
MGVLAPWDIDVTIEGDESLSKRPMRRITAPLMKMGVTFDPAGAETLPITEHGCRNLKAITYTSPMASAQLKTAVLLAGIRADGVTEINEPSVSRNHTELMLPEFGVATTAGERTAFNLFEGDGLIDVDRLDTVYASPEGTTVRLLEVSATMPLRIGFAPFVADNKDAPSPEKAFYRAATFREGKWELSEPICSAGEFLGKNIPDGSATYLGGMAFYYGAADAALGWRECITTDTNRVYIARFDGKDRVVESYQSTDYGKTYHLEQVLRRIPGDKEIKAWRPTVPIHAQDNMPVYWHEGRYVGHTGGWHSDIVTYIEYDD